MLTKSKYFLLTYSLIESCNDLNIRNKLDLNIKSNVLLIGCEGDTDQEMYQKLV